MFQLIQQISRLELAKRQLPCAGSAFIVATFFYKFGSFAVECLAFLATWFVIDLAYGLIRSRVATPRHLPGTGSEG